MRFRLFIILCITISTQAISQKYLLNEDVNKDTIIPDFGYKRKFDIGNYFSYGLPIGKNINLPPSDIDRINSWQFREGIWGRMKLTNWYAIGAYIEYSRDEYRMKSPLFQDTFNNKKTVWTKQINNNLVVGIFNRINIYDEKFYFDFGAYYAYDILPRVISKIESKNGDFKFKKTIYNRPSIMNISNFGLDARLTYKTFALYGRYRLTGLYKNTDNDIAKLMVGILFDFKKM
jgi:hypothetical protein